LTWSACGGLSVPSVVDAGPGTSNL